MTEQDRWTLTFAPTARRHLAEQLPETVASAAFAFITGPLAANPHRVGKRLREPLQDRHSARRGTYRVIYRINETEHSIQILGVFRRSDAYRTT